MKSIVNFSPGPAILPEKVLIQAKKELHNWNNLGISVMEISHRSKYFINMTEKIEYNLRKLLKIPKNYKIIFCQGGARTQFSAVPLNLLNINNAKADYVNTGHWGNAAIQEAKKYFNLNVINVKNNKNNIFSIIPMKNWDINTNAKYLHFCPNETIDGIAIHEAPIFNKTIVIADMSSVILSKPIKIKKYGIIYASAQKNIGPAGITLIIIRDDLLEYSSKNTPSTLNYKILINNNSMFNTPPTFSWYLTGLVFQWIKKQGGLKKISQINKKKSDILYNVIDKSNLYYNNISKKNRSNMNVTFFLKNPDLEKKFLEESNNCGLYALKGHSIVGGMRASIYNAMPIKGVQSLINFMIDFENRYI